MNTAANYCQAQNRIYFSTLPFFSFSEFLFLFIFLRPPFSIFQPKEAKGVDAVAGGGGCGQLRAVRNRILVLDNRTTAPF